MRTLLDATHNIFTANVLLDFTLRRLIIINKIKLMNAKWIDEIEWVKNYHQSCFSQQPVVYAHSTQRQYSYDNYQSLKLWLLFTVFVDVSLSYIVRDNGNEFLWKITH